MNSEERIIAVLSNFGRWEGWVIYQGDIEVCTLCYHSSGDQFWDYYVIWGANPLFDVRDDKFWDRSDLYAESRAVKGYRVDHLLCRWDSSSDLLSAHSLYISGVQLSKREQSQLLAKLRSSMG